MYYKETPHKLTCLLSRLFAHSLAVIYSLVSLSLAHSLTSHTHFTFAHRTRSQSMPLSHTHQSVTNLLTQLMNITLSLTLSLMRTLLLNSLSLTHSAVLEFLIVSEMFWLRRLRTHSYSYSNLLMLIFASSHLL